MKEILKGLALTNQTGTVESIGTVIELFGDFKEGRFYDKNRVNFQFYSRDTDERFLVVLSNSLAKDYATGKLTKAMCWNLPVYKVTTAPNGEPLTDSNGNIIPHMLVMGTPESGTFDPSKIKREKVSTHKYVPSGTAAFDDLIA